MKIKLIDICSPKQWKTIPTDELLDDGYPVYGANGLIGYSNVYNHKDSVIAITCRGASCGSVNITPPFSYVTGNAMCLDEVKHNIDINYLYYFLKNYNFKNIISGSAQPQITRQGLNKVYVRYYSSTKQKQIVSRLKCISTIIELKKIELNKFDDLIKARFIEMFGEPVNNPKKFEKRSLKDTCKIVTGNTPSRAVEEYYGDFVEWIKTDNIISGEINPTRAVEYLSEEGMKVGRVVEEDAILMACIAGSIASIGRVCVTDRTVAFNQQINAIVPYDYNQLFLYVLLQISKDYLIEDVSMALKGILSKSKLEEKEFIVPPIELQNQFADFVKQVDKSRFDIKKGIIELEREVVYD